MDVKIFNIRDAAERTTAVERLAELAGGLMGPEEELELLALCDAIEAYDLSHIPAGERQQPRSVQT